MSDASRTPETDAIVNRRAGTRWPAMVEHAEKLETQRDAALERERGLRKALELIVMRFDDDNLKLTVDAIQEARAAIAKAKGEQ